MCGTGNATRSPPTSRHFVCLKRDHDVGNIPPVVYEHHHYDSTTGHDEPTAPNKGPCLAPERFACEPGDQLRTPEPTSWTSTTVGIRRAAC